MKTSVFVLILFTGFNAQSSICDALYLNQAERIYSPLSYEMGDPRAEIGFDIADQRDNAEEIVDKVFDLDKILNAQLAETSRLVRDHTLSLLRDGLQYSRPAIPTSPLQLGLSRTVNILRTTQVLKNMTNDALIIFLSRSYEMQSEIQHANSITWQPWQDNSVKEHPMKMTTADLLTEIRSALWSEIKARKFTVNFIKRRIGEFFDIDMGGLMKSYDTRTNALRLKVLELFEVEGKMFFAFANTQP